MKKVLVLIACAAVSLVSCKKNTLESLGVQHDTQSAYTFKAVSSDPYTGPQPAGGAVYLLVKEAWGSGLKLNCYSIYSNRATGKPESDSGVIYYFQTMQSEDIRFGANVNANLEDFRNQVNDIFKKDGYAIIAAFYDGGPDNNKFSIYQLPKTISGTW